MQLDPQYWHGKRVCVTGGTGFLGWHIVSLLRALPVNVRVFGLRPKSSYLSKLLAPFDCTFGDVCDAGAVKDGIADCDVVIHTAGPVAVWGPLLSRMREIHEVGTRNVLAALPPDARLVHTSSVVAVGASRGVEALSEDSPFPLGKLRVDYVHAKRSAEEIALAGAKSGRDVVVVNPAYLVGPEDYERSVMGRFCERFWKQKMPLLPPGGLNFVDVRDVAMGHLLAAERGQAGRRYILGGSNQSIGEFTKVLSEAAAQPARRRFTIPAGLLSAFAAIGEMWALASGREPHPSLQYARLNAYNWFYDSSRSRNELGFSARPLRETLADTFRWHCDAGIVRRTSIDVSDINDAPHRRAA